MSKIFQNKLNPDSKFVRLTLTLTAILLFVVLLVCRGQTTPDFSTIPAGSLRKEAFFGYLKPVVATKNTKLLQQRSRLYQLQRLTENHTQLTGSDRHWLTKLGREYGLESINPPQERDQIAILLKRVDVIPAPLVFMQAAKESGWGTSRFARIGNNYFGQWCYKPGCGMVPENRADDKKHEVQSFVSLEQAIDAYYKNINTHSKYLNFRTLRAKLPDSEKQSRANFVADGMLYYSERRELYVSELKQMLYANRKYF